MLKQITTTLALLLLYTSVLRAGVMREVSEAACRVIAGNRCGSGTAVYQDNQSVYVLTNAHVVVGYSKATVEFWKYGKKVPHPIVGNIIWRKRDINNGIDFAIIDVLKDKIPSLPNIIPFIPQNANIIGSGTYVITAGCPRSQWLSVKEGSIVTVKGSEILFRPVSEDGQSGSGLFTQFNGRTYLFGVVTARTGEHIIRNVDGFDITLGVALSIDPLRHIIKSTGYTNTAYHMTVGKLYARGSDGKYYLQNVDGSVNVPRGVQITQWNCPGPSRPTGPQQALPQPSLPNGEYGQIPPGFGKNSKPKPIDVGPPDLQPLPKDDIEKLKKEKEELVKQVESKEKELNSLQTQIAVQSTTIEKLKKQLDTNKKDFDKQLATKESELQQLKQQFAQIQSTVNNLTIEIKTKDQKINKYEHAIKEIVTPPKTEIKTVKQPSKDHTSIWEKAKQVSPIWWGIAGIIGTLLFPKLKMLTLVPGMIGKVFKTKDAVETIVHNDPHLKQILDEYFSKMDAKIDAVGDYASSIKSKDSNVINNTINIDNDDLLAGLKGKTSEVAMERVKQFFALKQRDGESIEQWALYAVLYKEAMQLLRQGKFTVNIGNNKINLQGQRITADKIDEWVRDQYIKRTSIDKLQLDYIYHEAMLGFLYKEAVGLLRTGSFPILGAKETADAIENWVKQEFLKRMGINL